MCLAIELFTSVSLTILLQVTFSFHMSRFVAISSYDCRIIECSWLWWLIWFVWLWNFWNLGFQKLDFWNIVIALIAIDPSLCFALPLILQISSLFTFRNIFFMFQVLSSFPCMVTKVSHESGKAHKIKSNFISSSILLFADSACLGANCHFLINASIPSLSSIYNVTRCLKVLIFVVLSEGSWHSFKASHISFDVSKSFTKSICSLVRCITNSMHASKSFFFLFYWFWDGCRLWY